MSLSALSKKWAEISGHILDPYEAVEAFAGAAGASDWWPYVIVAAQLEAGWSDDVRGALAYHLAERFKPAEHGLAVFIALSGSWPTNNATTALNLLALAHRATSSTVLVGRFINCAVVRCLRQALSDPSQLVAEEAANVFGGLGAHHVSSVTPDDVTRVRGLVAKVIQGIEDEDLVTLLRSRADTTLANVKVAPVLDTEDVRRFLAEIEETWTRMAQVRGDSEPLAMLKTYVTALAWATLDGSAKSHVVHVVRIEDRKDKSDNASSAWSIVEGWFAVLRNFLDEDTPVVFTPLDVCPGSLIITFRIDGDAEACATILQRLRDGKDVLSSNTAEDFADALRLRGLRLRVAHVDNDRTSASLKLEPTSSDQVPLRSRKLATGEIPQANDLAKIITVVDCFATGVPITPEILDEVDPRQVQYYKAAARTLGLVSTPGDALTRIGWLLHVAAGDDRYRRLGLAFEASPCGQAWIEWSKTKKLSDVRAGSAKDFLAARSELSGQTVGRRASTLDKWLEKLRNYT